MGPKNTLPNKEKNACATSTGNARKKASRLKLVAETCDLHEAIFLAKRVFLRYHNEARGWCVPMPPT